MSVDSKEVELSEPLEILVVDDDEVDRLAARHALETSGLAVRIQEADGLRAARDAIARAAELGEPYDCVLLDDFLGEMAAGIAHDLLDAERRHRQVDLALDLVETPTICVDPIQVQQVVLNLLRNAMEAVGDEEPGRRRIVLRARREGDRLAVSVADEGSGCSPEVLDQIFDAFFSTKERGMGMGLAICRSIVDVRMPGMSGLELQDELRERGLEIPIVIMTAHADVPMAVRAMHQGALDFLEKPFNDQDLLDRLHRALDRDRELRRAREERRVAAERVERLTPREREVMEGVVRGRLNKQIAGDLNLAVKTVEQYRAQVMHKMEADSLADLVRMAFVLGIS